MLTVSLTAYSSPAPRTDYRPSFLSQARVDRFTFLGQKAKDALVGSSSTGVRRPRLVAPP